MRVPKVTPMARASTPTNGLKMLVAACMIALIDGALKTGSFVRHLLSPTTTYTNARRAGAGRTGSNRRRATTNRACRPLRPAYHANSEIRRAATYVTIASAAG